MRVSVCAGLLMALGVTIGPAAAQSDGTLARELAAIPAPSGSETKLMEAIEHASALPTGRLDNLGNLSYPLGQGPHPLLLVTEVDEPGFVVSAVLPNGYLRLKEVVARAPMPAGFTQLLFGNRVSILTAKEPVAGVGVGLSIHLQPSRKPETAPGYTGDDLYVDVGATSAAEVSAAGIQLLDPVVPEHDIFGGTDRPILVGTALAARVAVPSLLHVLQGLARQPSGRAIVVAFATQGAFGHRGLQRLLSEFDPSEVVLVRPFAASTENQVLHLDASDPAESARWKALTGTSLPGEPPGDPALETLLHGRRYLEIRFPVSHLHSAAELVDMDTLNTLTPWLLRWCQAPAAAPEAPR